VSDGAEDLERLESLEDFELKADRTFLAVLALKLINQ